MEYFTRFCSFTGVKLVDWEALIGLNRFLLGLNLRHRHLHYMSLLFSLFRNEQLEIQICLVHIRSAPSCTSHTCSI